MSDDFFSLIGINFKDLVAGFMGGVSNVVVLRKTKFLPIVGSIIVGGLTANYLGGTVAQLFGTSSGFSSFVVGLGGMAICQGIIESAGSWNILKRLRND